MAIMGVRQSAAAPQAPTAKASAEPVGEGDYVVAEDECLNSIAIRYGFFWKTLWDLPENTDLKVQRKDHNVLLPGDRIHIPSLRSREEPCATDQLHRFVRKGTPSRLKLRLLHLGSAEGFANKSYRLVLDGHPVEGTVDGEGRIDIPIDPGARGGVLTVEDHEFEVRIGGVDPIDSTTGVQQRLASLGFDLHGCSSGDWDDATIEALKKFQSAHVLENDDEEPSGEFDDRTRAKLAEVFGC
ncbi:MAG TPA: peptidoglycan-binding domain-containing protein [Bryobacteraceae bacterium]|nr:peptidoglycan-binding domain-containing protein [Bryobacteraceae bacterium]